MDVNGIVDLDGVLDTQIQEIASPALLDMLSKVEYCVFNCAAHAHTASCAFSELAEMSESGRSYSLPAAPFVELGHGNDGFGTALHRQYDFVCIDDWYLYRFATLSTTEVDDERIFQEPF